MAIEASSPTWRAVAAHANGAMASAQTKLEAPGLPLPQTEFQRGYVAALREVLKLASPDPAVAVETIDFEA